MTAGRNMNAMTVDVEEYFQVAALADAIPQDSWDRLESRVERSTGRLLELFDGSGIKATFFVLGWIAERHPALVRRIVAEGHELACHGFAHQLIYKQTPDDFRDETKRSRQILEDTGGVAVDGYRAASYSITPASDWAVDILAECGFRYDSSIVPVNHDLYGMSGAHPYPHVLSTAAGNSIVEFPPSTLQVAGVRIPVGGGGYFRLFPYWFTRWALRRIPARDDQPFVFYLHPWEIDADQPRVKASLKSRFRHYNNLDKCEGRLERLLRDFAFDTMSNVLAGLSHKPAVTWSARQPDAV